MNNYQLINQTSNNTEYYTPFKFPNAAREAMGGIDLDPASSRAANKHIKATTIYTRPSCNEFLGMGDLPLRQYNAGGELEQWSGRVWMNHPFGTEGKACVTNYVCDKKTCRKRGYHLVSDSTNNTTWVNKLVKSYKSGNVTEAYMICFASTSENWFKPLKQFPQCYIDGRVNYLDPETLEEVKGVTKGSVITYFGNNVELFHKHFGEFGTIQIPYWMSYE